MDGMVKPYAFVFVAGTCAVLIRAAIFMELTFMEVMDVFVESVVPTASPYLIEFVSFSFVLCFYSILILFLYTRV